LEPRFETHTAQLLYKSVTSVAKEGVEDVFHLSWRHANRIIAPVDVPAHDVVAVGHLLQGLGPGDDYFTSGENGCRYLLHFLRWFEFYFDRGILVRLKTDREHVRVRTKVFGDFHQVHVIVQAVVAVYHDHSKVFTIDGTLHVQVSLENCLELTDDTLTIKEVTTPRHLNGTIWENFHTLSGKAVYVCECDLIVKGVVVYGPLKIRFRGPLSVQREVVDPRERLAELRDINVLTELGDHRDRGNLDPRRTCFFVHHVTELIDREHEAERLVRDRREHDPGAHPPECVTNWGLKDAEVVDSLYS